MNASPSSKNGYPEIGSITDNGLFYERPTSESTIGDGHGYGKDLGIKSFLSDLKWKIDAGTTAKNPQQYTSGNEQFTQSGKNCSSKHTPATRILEMQDINNIQRTTGTGGFESEVNDNWIRFQGEVDVFHNQVYYTPTEDIYEFIIAMLDKGDCLNTISSLWTRNGLRTMFKFHVFDGKLYCILNFCNFGIRILLVTSVDTVQRKCKELLSRYLLIHIIQSFQDHCEQILKELQIQDTHLTKQEISTIANVCSRFNLNITYKGIDCTTSIFSDSMASFFTKYKEGGFNQYGNEQIVRQTTYQEFPDHYVKRFVLRVPAGCQKYFLMDTETEHQYSIQHDFDIDGTSGVHFTGLVNSDLTNTEVFQDGELVPTADYIMLSFFSSSNTETFRGELSTSQLWLVSCSEYLSLQTVTVKYRKNGLPPVEDFYGGAGTNPAIMSVPAPPLLGGFNEYGNEQIYYCPTLGWLVKDISDYKGCKHNQKEKHFVDAIMLYVYGLDGVEEVEKLSKEQDRPKKNVSKFDGMTNSEVSEVQRKTRAQKRSQWKVKNDEASSRIMNKYSKFVDLCVDYIGNKLSRKTFMNYVNVCRDKLYTSCPAEIDWLKQDNTSLLYPINKSLKYSEPKYKYFKSVMDTAPVDEWDNLEIATGYSFIKVVESKVQDIPNKQVRQEHGDLSSFDVSLFANLDTSCMDNTFMGYVPIEVFTKAQMSSALNAVNNEPVKMEGSPQAQPQAQINIDTTPGNEDEYRWSKIAIPYSNFPSFEDWIKLNNKDDFLDYLHQRDISNRKLNSSMYGSVGPGRIQSQLNTDTPVDNRAAFIHDRLYNILPEDEALSVVEAIVPGSNINKFLSILQYFGNGKASNQPKPELKRMEGSFNPYGNGQTERHLKELFPNGGNEIIKKYTDIHFTSSNNFDANLNITTDFFREHRTIVTNVRDQSRQLGMEPRYANIYTDWLTVNNANNGALTRQGNTGCVRIKVSTDLSEQLFFTMRTKQIVDASKTSAEELNKLIEQRNSIDNPRGVLDVFQNLPANTAPGIRFCLIDGLMRRMATNRNLSSQQLMMVTAITDNAAPLQYLDRLGLVVANPVLFPMKTGFAGNTLPARYMTFAAYRNSTVQGAWQPPAFDNTLTRYLNDDLEVTIPFDDTMAAGVDPAAWAYYIMLFLEYPFNVWNKRKDLTNHGGVYTVNNVNSFSFSNLVAIEGAKYPIFTYSRTYAANQNANYPTISLRHGVNNIIPVTANEMWGTNNSVDILPFMQYWMDRFQQNHSLMLKAAEIARTWLVQFQLINESDIEAGEKLAAIYSYRTMAKSAAPLVKPANLVRFHCESLNPIPAGEMGGTVWTRINPLTLGVLDVTLAHLYLSDLTPTNPWVDVIAGVHQGLNIPGTHSRGIIHMAWNHLLKDPKRTLFTIPKFMNPNTMWTFDEMLNHLVTYNLSSFFWNFPDNKKVNMSLLTDDDAQDPILVINPSADVDKRNVRQGYNNVKTAFLRSFTGKQKLIVNQSNYTPYVVIGEFQKNPDAFTSPWNLSIIGGKMHQRPREQTLSDTLKQKEQTVWSHERNGNFTWRLKPESIQIMMDFMTSCDWTSLPNFALINGTDTVDNFGLQVHPILIVRDLNGPLDSFIYVREFPYGDISFNWSPCTRTANFLTLTSAQITGITNSAIPIGYNTVTPKIFYPLSGFEIPNTADDVSKATIELLNLNITASASQENEDTRNRAKQNLVNSADTDNNNAKPPGMVDV